MDLQDTEKEKRQTSKGESDVKKGTDICVKLLEAKQYPEPTKAERSWVGAIRETSGEVWCGNAFSALSLDL